MTGQNTSTRSLLARRAAVNVGWYVAVKSGKRQGLLYGPFNGEADAESWIGPVRAEAERIDSWAWGYTFGVARVEVPADQSLPSVRLIARMDADRS